jgi:signal peptidase I
MKEKTIIIDLLILVFIFALGAIVSNIFSSNLNMPFGHSADVTSPSNWIDESQVNVYQDKVILNVENSRWIGFTNTNSMDPIFDVEANVIEIVPESLDDINVGDIISFKVGTQTYIHRVIAKDYDDQGIYFITKGDNNPDTDPVIVREPIGVVVGIIY